MIISPASLFIFFAALVTGVDDNLGVSVGLAYDARNLLAVQSWQGTGIDPVRLDVSVR